MLHNNPLTSLLKKALASGNKTREDLVTYLGFTNRNKGFLRVDAFLASPQANQDWLNKVAAFLNIPEDEVEQAREETCDLINRQQMEDTKRQEHAARKAFHPYLSIRHQNSRPSSITIACFVGVHNFKTLHLPDRHENLCREDAVEQAGTIAAAHYREKRGECPMFGKITGYVYQFSYDRGLLMNTAGTVIGTTGQKKNADQGYISVGKKKICRGLLRYDGN